MKSSENRTRGSTIAERPAGRATLSVKRLAHCYTNNADRSRVSLRRIFCKHFLQLPRFISERELTLTFAIARPSVVCCLSVTFVHPTQPVEIFGNISTPFDTLAIHWHSLKI